MRILVLSWEFPPRIVGGIARHVAELYPESFEPTLSDDLAYTGPYFLTDAVDGCPLDAGKMVLSPTRTYAPIMLPLFKELGQEIHGIIHCSGGGQTKILHFSQRFIVRLH